MKQEILTPDVPVPQSVAWPRCIGMQDERANQRYVLKLTGGSYWELTYDTLFKIQKQIEMTPENLNELFRQKLIRQLR